MNADILAKQELELYKNMGKKQQQEFKTEELIVIARIFAIYSIATISGDIKEAIGAKLLIFAMREDQQLSAVVEKLFSVAIRDCGNDDATTFTE